MKKRIASLALAAIMCFTLVMSVSAGNISKDELDASIAASSVSQDTIEQIYANHTAEQAVSQRNMVFTDISTDEVFETLGVIYLEIEKAQENYDSSPTADNRNTLDALIESQANYENILTARGFVFLTQEEVDTIFGISNITPMLDTPTKPKDTSNHRFALSATYSTRANGKVVKYFYVTATPLSTSSLMYKSYVIDIAKNSTVAKYIDALVEVYASKITGTVVAAIKPVLSWLPYELLSFNPNENTTAKSDYQIRASFTSTPRFVWAGYENDTRYYLEGTLHSTSVSEVHTIVSVVNGKTITDVKKKDYIESTEHYSLSEVNDFVIYQYEEGSTAIQEKNKFEYYFEDSNGKRTKCSTITAPWASDYNSLN